MARCTLANDRQRATSEVVQVYAGRRGGGIERPLWRLVGFARTDVDASGTAAMELRVPLERLAVRIDGAWVVEPGDYEFAVGLQARDPRAVILPLRV